MLFRELLTSELHNQRADFQRFAETQFSDLTDYLEKLQKLCTTSSAEIWEDLRVKDDVGALPSAELDNAKSFSFSFTEKWDNHEDNEPLDILEKIEKRDRDRYELNEDSKDKNDQI